MLDVAGTKQDIGIYSVYGFSAPHTAQGCFSFLEQDLYLFLKTQLAVKAQNPALKRADSADPQNVHSSLLLRLPVKSDHVNPETNQENEAPEPGSSGLALRAFPRGLIWRTAYLL